MWNLP
jgi:hypothetical protein